MDFAPSERSRLLQDEVRRFLDEAVLPAEPLYHHQVAQHRADGDPYRTPAVIGHLKAQARERGLWNLFLPDAEHGAGLSVLDYAPIAELSGRSYALAPEAMNCAAPDTGNMEVLAMFGTAEQQERWLTPLLEGRIRSCFSMTEPDVASSDATNIAARITRDGDEYVVNGRKWWSSGALRPECEIAIVMAVSEPDAERHARHSMILVPLDTPASRCTGRRPSSATTTAPTAGTARSASTTSGCRRATSSARRAPASRSPRRGSGRGGSTTACARSGWGSGRWSS